MSKPITVRSIFGSDIGREALVFVRRAAADAGLRVPADINTAPQLQSAVVTYIMATLAHAAGIGLSTTQRPEDTHPVIHGLTVIAAGRLDGVDVRIGAANALSFELALAGDAGASDVDVADVIKRRTSHYKQVNEGIASLLLERIRAAVS